MMHGQRYIKLWMWCLIEPEFVYAYS